MSPRAFILLSKDWLRGCRWWRWPAALFYASYGCVARASQERQWVKSLDYLCRAVRLIPSSRLAFYCEEQARHQIQSWRGPIKPQLFDARGEGLVLEKAVLLKPPISPREPGVLYIAFEYQWMRLLHLSPEAREVFARQYTLVLAPSWSPPHSPFNFYFPCLWPTPVVCQISHPDDVQWLPRLSSRYQVLPLMPSHWVNPEAFSPRPRHERDVDLVMVANFAAFKRHAAFFKALRHLPRQWKVVLIGQPEAGRTAADIWAEAAAFGVADRFILRESVSHEEVCETLCRARTSVVLSRREGACVVVAESLFADTPVGLVAGAHIGSGAFVHADTGRWLDETRLAEDLRLLVEQAHTFQPRQWALKARISCHDSSQRLNEWLRQKAWKSGQEWTCDLAPLQWRPNPCLIHPEDKNRLAPACAALASAFGVRLPAQLGVG